MAKNPNILEVSFKEKELDLMYAIKTRCHLNGISGWMKEAAYEKLEREKNPELYFSNPNERQSRSIQTQMNKPKVDLPFDLESVNSLLGSFE